MLKFMAHLFSSSKVTDSSEINTQPREKASDLIEVKVH